MVNWSKHTKCTLPFNRSNTTPDKTKTHKVWLWVRVQLQSLKVHKARRCILIIGKARRRVLIIGEAHRCEGAQGA